MGKLRLFRSLGNTYMQSLKDTKTAFITFTAPSNLSDLLITKAPVTGVNINQSVDFNVTKALDKNFLISAFGDRLVSISISGLNIFDASCKSASIYTDTNEVIATEAQTDAVTIKSSDNVSITSKSNDQIAAFYAKYKLSANINNRIDIGIAGLSGGSCAFRCALISLDIEANSSKAVAGVYTYTMGLVGVAL